MNYDVEMNKIISELKKKDLIRSEFFSKVIVKLKNKELYAGTYKLSKDLSTNEIISMLEDQNNVENESIKITFVEGKRLSTYVKQISDNFPYTEEEINNKLSDKDYLNKLMNKYSFITEDILDEKIYYPLEGYLYPDTYEFKKNSTIEEIIDKAKLTIDDTYISGITFGLGTDTLTNQLLEFNPFAVVQVKNNQDVVKTTGALGTGDKITITSNKETKTFELVLYGDVNGDGVITNLDLLRVQRHLWGDIVLTGAHFKAADVYKDGKITNLDLLRVQRHIWKDIIISQN